MRITVRVTAWAFAVCLLAPWAGARDTAKRAEPLSIGDVDVTQTQPLSVDEAGIRIAWEGEVPYAVLPVENSGATALRAQAFAAVRLALRWQFEDGVDTQLGPGRTDVRVPIAHAGEWLRRNAHETRLEWMIRVPDEDIRLRGLRSASEAAAQLRITVSIPARPLAGEPVPFRATVTREPDGQVAAGAVVRVVESHDRYALPVPGLERGPVLFEGSADGFGTLDGEVLLSAGTWARGLAFTAVDADASGAVMAVVQPLPADEAAPAGRVLLSTDKPVYQPGQEIHVRVLALRAGDLLPAAGTTIAFTIRDPRGTRILLEERVVDAFGVAHVSLPLADELLLGDYRIDVTGDGLAASGSVEVREYDLPRFAPAITTDQSYATPGQELSGEISVQYVFGEAVRRARVDVELLRDEDSVEADASDRVRTRNDGTARFRVRVPEHFTRRDLEEGTAAVHLRVTAQDEAGQRESATVRLPVSSGDLRVRLVAESGRLETGAPNVFHLATLDASGSPVVADCDVRLGGKALGSARTDERGHARLVTGPLPSGRELEVTATVVPRGARVTQSFAFEADTAAGYLLARPDVALVSAGREFGVDLLSSEEGSVVRVDLIASQRVVASATATITDGAGRVAFTPSAHVAGNVCVEAHAVAADGSLLADRRRLIVDLGGDLRVDLTPDRAEYRPADEASIDVAVRLPDGGGVQAELGVTAVDEAVYLLTAGRAGSEGLALSGSTLDGGESLGGGVTLGDLLAGERAAHDQELAAAILAAQPDDAEVDSRSFRRTSELQYTVPVVSRDAESIARFFRDKGRRARRRHMASGRFADPWGTAYRLDIRGHPRQIQVVSAGPDEQFGTDDDIELLRRVRPPRDARFFVGGFDDAIDEEVVFLGPPDWRTDTGAPGVGTGFEDTAGGEAAPAAQRVRSFFPETLLVLPDLLTDGQGNATLPLRLADSLTTWRVAALASTADGRLGSGSAALTVKQEIAADLRLPRRLTQGDRLELPAIAYNLTDDARTLTLSLAAAPWFEVAGSPQRTVDVQPHSAARVAFDVHVLAHGDHALRLDLTDGEFADAVQLPTRVAPDARPVAFTRSGQIDGTATEIIEIPATAHSDSIGMKVRVLPGVVSQTLEGLDALLREPHGCFEQTSSAAYPNALILRYLRDTGSGDPQTEARAERLLAIGMQRLLGFEVGSGGFSYWGTPPTNLPLTAYALREFSDIARVRDVDPKLLERIAGWLVSRQHPDGAWRPTEGAAAQRYETDPVRVTAYVAWALTDAGRSGTNVQRALEFVRAGAGAESDLYTRVVCANALLAADAHDAVGLSLLQGILAERIEDEDGTYWGYSSGSGRTDLRGITSSAGVAVDNEVTAMIVQALLADGGQPQVVSDVLRHLAGARQKWGAWGSTHATIWTIKAFVDAHPGASLAATAQVTVAVNGQAAGVVRFDGRDVVRELDVSAFARPGSNVVEITTDQGLPYYTVTGAYFAPWTEPPPEPENLVVDVELVTRKKRRLRSGRPAVMNVRIRNRRGGGAAEMVTAVVGLAPGCGVDEHALRDLRDAGRIDRYELTGTGVNLYLPRLEEGASVEVPLTIVPALPGKVRVPHTIAYEYYDPTSRGAAPPQLVEIR